MDFWGGEGGARWTQIGPTLTDTATACGPANLEPQSCLKLILYALNCCVFTINAEVASSDTPYNDKNKKSVKCMQYVFRKLQHFFYTGGSLVPSNCHEVIEI
jgi:hypothetical protein